MIAFPFFRTGDVAAQESVEPLEEQAIRQAVAGIENSVIRLETLGGTSRVEGQIVSSGPATGLVITADGYALSASFHFANQPASIFARLPNGERASVEVVGRDETRKIVLLKIQSDFNFSIPNTAGSSDCRVGQTVIAVGRVFDPNSPNVSSGIISARNRIWDKAIQTDAKISPANFGGPLLDLQGRVLGILVPMNPESDKEMAGTEWYDSGIGFAVPIGDILSRFEDLKKGSTLRRGLLGVSFKGNDLFADPALVGFCRGSSPAGKSGIRPGDEIVEVNGKPIVRQSELKHALGPRYAGDVVHVVVSRSGQRLAFDVPLAGEIEPFIPPAIGVILRHDSNSELVVDALLADQAAERAGIQPGDRIVKFNDLDVGDKDSLRLMIAAAEIESKISLTVERNGASREFVLMVGKLESGLTPVISTGGKQLPAARLVDIKIADIPNPCYAIVPDQKLGDAPPALLVWIPEPGKVSKEDLAKDWLDRCSELGVVLLVPESAANDRWSPGEIDFVISAIDKLARQVRFDRQRVVIGGAKTGGTMASLILFSHRELFRGLVLIHSGLSNRLSRVETSPVEPLLVFLGTDDRSQEAVKSTIARLEQAHVPFHAEQQKDRVAVADWIAEILNWVNFVDRL